MSAAALQASVDETQLTQLLEFERNYTDSLINQRYYRVSTCRRYSIAKVCLDGEKHYEAWRRGALNQPAEHLGTRKTFAGASGLCQRHADKNP